MVPTPAAARYCKTGDPSPPAPITSTRARFRAACPGPPISRSRMWRAFARCDGVRFRRGCGLTYGGAGADAGQSLPIGPDGGGEPAQHKPFGQRAAQHIAQR